MSFKAGDYAPIEPPEFKVGDVVFALGADSKVRTATVRDIYAFEQAWRYVLQDTEAADHVLSECDLKPAWIH